MRFFEFTSSNGNTAHVPVNQFLRIETFDDYQAGNGVVQVLFRNADEENPYIVTINTTRGRQMSVASRIQGELSEGSNDSILIRPKHDAQCDRYHLLAAVFIDQPAADIAGSGTGCDLGLKRCTRSEIRKGVRPLKSRVENHRFPGW